jgi:hypothetical protein
MDEINKPKMLCVWCLASRKGCFEILINVCMAAVTSMRETGNFKVIFHDGVYE